MGWWTSLLEMLRADGSDIASPPPRAGSTSAHEQRRGENRGKPRSESPQHEPGALFDGVVEYVGGTFIKVRSGSVVAVVFLRELADWKVDNPAEVVSQDDHVGFVLLGPSTKKPSEWVASLAAADEARMRARMRALPEDAELDCRVVAIHDKGVDLECDGLRGWAPIGELSHEWIDHPTDFVKLGQIHRARVTRLDCPDNWLEQKRARKAKLIVSIKICMPVPESLLVEMPFSALPFRLSAQARKPHACDAVALYVLEELDAGVTLDAIGSATGFTMPVLQSILRLLEAKNLVRRGEPTLGGSKLAATMHRARCMNEAPPRGLFVSTAPLASLFVRRESLTASRGYPTPWPSPPYDPRVEDSFLGYADEALPQALIDSVTDELMRATVLDMLHDVNMRIFLRWDTSRGARRVVYLLVPEHWVLAGLWSAFVPAGTPPFRPVSSQNRCRDFLLVRVRVPGTTPDEPVGDFYYEPVTATYWKPRPDVTLKKVRESDETAFPEMLALPVQDKSNASSESKGKVKSDVVDALRTTDATAYERRWCRVKT